MYRIAGALQGGQVQVVWPSSCKISMGVYVGVFRFPRCSRPAPLSTALPPLRYRCLKDVCL